MAPCRVEPSSLLLVIRGNATVLAEVEKEGREVVGGVLVDQKRRRRGKY